MTTSRDLLMVTIERAPGRPVEQGDVSLALAGAELIDLLDTQAIELVGEHIVPIHHPATGDRLLEEAVASLVRQEPYESVGDWLWRRGLGLFSRYLAALEADEQLTREGRRRLLRTGRTVLADSPAHREATKRWASGDTVLAALAAAAGVHGEQTDESAVLADNAVATVLAEVDAAVAELGLLRLKQTIEGAAFDNIWRGG
jgi:hypothetical protein